MLDPYLDAMEQHIAETVEDLDTVRSMLLGNGWSRVERKGAESFD